MKVGKLEGFLEDTRGYGMLTAAIGIIVLAVAVLIGVVIYGNVAISMPTSNLPAALNNTLPTLHQNVATSFNLLIIGLIVMAAAFIIGILVRLLQD